MVHIPFAQFRPFSGSQASSLSSPALSSLFPVTLRHMCGNDFEEVSTVTQHLPKMNKIYGFVHFFAISSVVVLRHKPQTHTNHKHNTTSQFPNSDSVVVIPLSPCLWPPSSPSQVPSWPSSPPPVPSEPSTASSEVALPHFHCVCVTHTHTHTHECSTHKATGP